MGVSELRRLRQLEEENAKLKQIVADLSLDKQMLQDILKKALRLAQRKQLAQSMIDDYMISVRRACLVVMIHRSLWYYKPYGRDDMAIHHRILEISQVRVRYGVERIFVLLRREGWRDSFNRIYRIYKEEGLNLRTKRPKRRRAAAHRQERPELSRINQCWSMYFVSDQMFDGRRFRALTIVDNFSRKCMAIHTDQYLKGPDVVNVLDRLKAEQNEVPERI